MVTRFPVNALRAAFPSLAHVGPHDLPYAFLDGPGGSQVPQRVVEAISTYLVECNANLGGSFPTSRASDELVHNARLAAADMTGATADEIAFGPNMSTVNILLSQAACRTLTPGDEILVTALDHDANVLPWRQAAEDYGLVVHEVRLHTEDGTLDLGHLEELLCERTRIVAFTLASNALGTITPARAIAQLAHQVGAIAWADAVHYGPHRLIDRSALGVDVLVTSPYKWFGPHLGLAVIRRDLALAWSASRLNTTGADTPGQHFEAGAKAHELLAGLVAAVEYLADLGRGPTRRDQLADAFAQIRAHEDELADQFLAEIRSFPHVTLYGITDPARIAERVATFSFRVDGIAPADVADRLLRDGIFVWNGSFHATTTIRALGLEDEGGLVRAGFLHYNTLGEVDRLLNGLLVMR